MVRRDAGVAVLLLLIGSLSACASGSGARAAAGAMRPSEDVRRQLRAVTVVVRDGTAVTLGEAPREAESGATVGSGAGVVIEDGDTAVVVVPIFVGVWSTIGAPSAETRRRIEAENDVLRAVITNAAVPARLRDAVARLVPERAGVAISGGPASGEDVVLELSVREVRLDGESGASSRLALVIPVETRLVRAAAPPGGAYRATWRGVARERGDWVAADARLVREEIGRAVDGLAERFVEELFLVVPTPFR